ncbi:putative tyrosine-protein phosphatase C17A3.03c [Golovinomyces cichoracearum]|uniref:diphosphoinositol-polyphosphate diphosphatase n=1 Tax=Golovinomyces cichoracearum TaxID=62708 RepID=A0A420I975_9PEZI|nr:putative tyrosine-protein phosphatase C17A3.03c [Golovinomyces cichoracearum]
MNGAKVSRRTVYENEPKVSEFQSSIVVNETGKIKTEKPSIFYAVDAKVFLAAEPCRDVNKKTPNSKEDRSIQVALQPIQQGQDEASTPSLNPKYRPTNFGIVAPGIYRSSFPISEDFQYLQSLQLKTILSLVKKDFSLEFQDFVKSNNINHIVLDMIGTKKVEISEAMMKNIISIALDQSRYPILIHCNHGRHRTGCAVAAVRYVKGWELKNTLREYHDFAAPKARECDINYITNLQGSTLRSALRQRSKDVPRTSLLSKFIYPKTRRMLFLSVILIVMFMTLRCSRGMNLRSKQED